MSGISIGIAEHGDLARITEIYNYCVLNTPVTFDVEACTTGRREPWFRQFGATGRHRLLVAEEMGWCRDMWERCGSAQRPLMRRRLIARSRRWGREWAGDCVARFLKR